MVIKSRYLARVDLLPLNAGFPVMILLFLRIGASFSDMIKISCWFPCDVAHSKDNSWSWKRPKWLGVYEFLHHKTLLWKNFENYWLRSRKFNRILYFHDWGCLVELKIQDPGYCPSPKSCHRVYLFWAVLPIKVVWTIAISIRRPGEWYLKDQVRKVIGSADTVNNC